MSLLPKSVEEFQLQKYWDKFFTKRSSAFEWYGDYLDLCGVLHKYLKSSNKILVVGCGNSTLSESLYDVGFHSIDNIDISDVVIRQMMSKNAQKRPKMTFTKMDMLEMTFSDGVFDCVLDKGTLDAIFSNTDQDTVTKVDLMFNEIERVLKISGRYICITLAQEHILSKLLERFSCHWLMRVHRVLLASEKSGSIGGSLPVFVFILTKMMKIDGRAPVKVFEYVVDDQCVRCDKVEGIASFVKDNQQYAIVSHHLSSVHPNEPSVGLDLWSPAVTSEPRYTLTVLDLPKPKAKNGPFAIFIVPQGKETDWLFSCDYGRFILADSAGYERLVIVTLHRGHAYSSLEEVKEEVAGRAVQLVQAGVADKIKHPVLTLGDGIGSRVVLYEGSSSHSGSFVVEEVARDSCRIRRLVFLDTPHLAQTEITIRRTQPSKSKKSKKKSQSYGSVLKVDHTQLLFKYHKVITAALSLVPGIVTAGHQTRGLLVGLGGGALPMYLGTTIPELVFDVVELDSEILAAAEKWFGFVQSEKCHVHLTDGVAFIQDTAKAGKTECYSFVILDVDNKDRSVGVSSPPTSFVTTSLLRDVYQLLGCNGILLTNMAARNKQSREKVLQNISEVFTNVWLIPISEDLNEIVVASPSLSGPGLLSGGVQTVQELAALVSNKHVELSKEWNEWLASADRFTTTSTL